jgi:hypothetical protein
VGLPVASNSRDPSPQAGWISSVAPVSSVVFRSASSDVHSQNLVHHEGSLKSSSLLLYRTTRYIIDFYLESKMLRFNVRGVRSIDGATRALFTRLRAATRMA